MAHELEMMNGKANMAYVGEVPWHGLGTQVDEGISPMEMMKVAGLDWEVEKRENLFMDSRGIPHNAGNFSLVRENDNKVLTTVGKDWNPVQNKEAFKFFEEFCEAGNMKMHTAGSLFDGKRVWAMAKVASDFTVFGDDRVEGYLLFSNPHMFGHCVDVRFTPIRVVCNNTLTMSLSDKVQNFAKINHRNVFDPSTVKEILGLASVQMDEYKNVAEYLGSKQITQFELERFLSKVFGESKKDGKMVRSAEQAFEIFETQPGSEFAPGSYWQALNAVTYVTDHVLGRSSESRLNNIWFGSQRKRKISAVKHAIAMAGA